MPRRKKNLMSIAENKKTAGELLKMRSNLKCGVFGLTPAGTLEIMC